MATSSMQIPVRPTSKIFEDRRSTPWDSLDCAKLTQLRISFRIQTLNLVVWFEMFLSFGSQTIEIRLDPNGVSHKLFLSLFWFLTMNLRRNQNCF